MVRGITVVINGTDYSDYVEEFFPYVEITYGRVVVTLDDKEHTTQAKKRKCLSLKLFPFSAADVASLYSDLSAGIVAVQYSAPSVNSVVTLQMRVVSNFENDFALKSHDGNVYYKGGTIKFRSVEVS